MQPFGLLLTKPHSNENKTIVISINCFHSTFVLRRALQVCGIDLQVILPRLNALGVARIFD